MNPDLELALEMAKAADIVALSRYRAVDLSVETKPDFTPVTEADRTIETNIRKTLAQLRPDDGIVGEEFPNTNETAKRVWIIDPIDATKNYVRGVPVWGTLISLAIAGEPTIGVVSAPAMGRLWWSSPEDGAFTRDVDGTTRAIQVSGVKSLSDASFSYSDKVGWEVFKDNALENLTTAVWRTRGYGDFWSHLLVAEGAVDIAIEPELQTYDLAAFVAIVHGAGGKVTGSKGQSAYSAGQAISTNSILHTEVLNFLA